MKPPRSVPNACSPVPRSLDQRIASRPALATRLHALLDTLDAALAEGCSADEAEERVLGPLRQLGQDVLQQWAGEANARAEQRARRVHPTAVRDGKKNS